jgi:23S rRNA (cytosine1962-C5)-methyltransferase
VQFTTAGGEFWREQVLDCMEDISSVKGVYERSDVDLRGLEGLEQRSGPLRGEPVPEPFYIEENGLRFRIDIVSGQKTGFFLDQRSQRAVVSRWVQEGKVLDAFCYSGGFGLNALRGGAEHVTFLDSSEDALQLAKDNVQ